MYEHCVLGSAIFTLDTTGTQMDRDNKCNIKPDFFACTNLEKNIHPDCNNYSCVHWPR